MDDHFVAEKIFYVLGLSIIVRDSTIADALKYLTGNKRDIILLSSFLDMFNREIGDKLNMLRAKVQYQRKSTLRQLKKLMEEVANE